MRQIPFKLRLAYRWQAFWLQYRGFALRLRYAQQANTQSRSLPRHAFRLLSHPITMWGSMLLITAGGGAAAIGEGKYFVTVTSGVLLVYFGKAFWRDAVQK